MFLTLEVAQWRCSRSLLTGEAQLEIKGPNIWAAISVLFREYNIFKDNYN